MPLEGSDYGLRVFIPKTSSLGFSALIMTGINEIHTALPTFSQSEAVNNIGSLPIANTAVIVVANSALK